MSSSMFRNIDHMEINDGNFTMEVHMNTDLDLERLRPAHKADYKTVLGDEALKREECTPGTRVKILQDITNWAHDPSSGSPRVFWLTGQAGSGKTTIAYTITKRFAKGGNDDRLQTVLGGNFLCSRQFEETRERTRIVPTIAYQLAHKCQTYAEALHKAKKFDAVYHDIPTQLKDLLVGPWQQSSRSLELPLYLIVIDALDEIKGDGGSAFLRDLLTVIDEYNLRGFKFLVTSRSEPEVVTLCESFTSEAVCWLQHVPNEEVEMDIRTYLKIKLPKLVSSPELAELVRQADGLFIYAATTVKYLTPHRLITVREQTKMLKNLLSGTYKPANASKPTFLIDILYRQIMIDAFSMFEAEFLTCRLRILYTFLCTVERTSTSIAAALVAEEDDDVAQAVTEGLHAVLYIQDNRVFWYHSSFPDFIFDPSRSNFDGFAFWCNESAHHKLLGESCFRIMKSGLRFNIGDIRSSFLFDSGDPEALYKNVNNNINAVLRYSTCHWTHHLPSPQLIDTDGLLFCISEFLQIRVLFWIETMNLLKLRNQCTPMLQRAHEWILECGSAYSGLARDIGEAANFATYFTGSPAAESTPHLYISALATWTQDTKLCRHWKNQFSRIPVFAHTKGGMDVPLMTIMAGGPVKVVALSRDGMRIVSGLNNGTLRVWDASTGAELNALYGLLQVNSVAFSTDGMRIVSGSLDRTVRVWDASTGAELNVLYRHTGSVNSVAFSMDGMRIVSGSNDRTVRMWDALTGAELNVLYGHTHSVLSVAFSTEGMRIVSGSLDRTVRVWDVSTGAELNVLDGHIHPVNSVAFSTDGMRIASGSDDRTVRVWNASTGAELNVLCGHTDSVTSVAFSMDGMRVLSGSRDMTVRVWDGSTGAELNVLKCHWLNSVAFSRDGMRIVSGSGDETVRVWDASTCAELNVLKGHTHSVQSVAFSKDGMRLVSGSLDSTVRVWGASTGAELNVLDGHTNSVNSVAFSTDGMRIASGSDDETVRVWDAWTGAELNVLKGHTDWVNSVAFSTDGMRVVSGSSDQTVRVWDASTGAELNVLKGHTHSVNSVAFSSEGMRVLSGSRDRTVRVWDASTGAELNVLCGHTDWVNSIAFSRDGMRIVSGSDDRTVRVWDASTRAEPNVLCGHTHPVRSVAFSTDGMRIVSGTPDRTVRVWDASTGAELNVLDGHTDWVRSVAFSTDGMRIVSGSDDRTVRVWDVSTGAELNTPSNLVQRQYPWHTTQKNWIVSSQEHHLMWVPPEAEVIQPPAIFVISQRGFGTVDFRQSMMGLEWIGCYTP